MGQVVCLPSYQRGAPEPERKVLLGSQRAQAIKQAVAECIDPTERDVLRYVRGVSRARMRALLRPPGGLEAFLGCTPGARNMLISVVNLVTLLGDGACWQTVPEALDRNGLAGRVSYALQAWQPADMTIRDLNELATAGLITLTPTGGIRLGDSPAPPFYVTSDPSGQLDQEPVMVRSLTAERWQRTMVNPKSPR